MVRVTNRDALLDARAPLRSVALDLLETGLAAIDTKSAIYRAVQFAGETLLINNEPVALTPAGRLIVIAIGKCALVAATTLENILGDRITAGVAIDIRQDPTCPTVKIRCFIGDHPYPTNRNVTAAAEVKKLLTGLTAADTVIIAISGGGSTLLCQPGNFTCFDEGEIIKQLFAVGASINEINILRKHLSSARGGWLAVNAQPAQVIGLIFSDVPGDDLGVVASGPTVYDETTVADATAVFEKFNLATTVKIRPADLLETPKNRDWFKRTRNFLIVSNRLALEAMAIQAGKLGFSSNIKTATLTGEAAVAATLISRDLTAAASPACLLYGGETIVTGSGAGSGGRCQEIALAALSTIQTGELILPFASDGRDNSAAAGAICDMITKAKVEEKKLPLTDYLRRHDGLAFFELTGDLVLTGPTGANVSDLIIAFKN